MNAVGTAGYLPASVRCSARSASTIIATSSGNVNANFYLLTPAPAPVSLRAAMSGANTILSIPTQAGFSYLVLFKNDLTEANWKLLTLVSGDGTTLSVNDPAARTGRFYRVLVQ